MKKREKKIKMSEVYAELLKIQRNAEKLESWFLDVVFSRSIVIDGVPRFPCIHNPGFVIVFGDGMSLMSFEILSSGRMECVKEPRCVSEYERPLKAFNLGGVYSWKKLASSLEEMRLMADWRVMLMRAKLLSEFGQKTIYKLGLKP